MQWQGSGRRSGSVVEQAMIWMVDSAFSQLLKLWLLWLLSGEFKQKISLGLQFLALPNHDLEPNPNRP